MAKFAKEHVIVQLVLLLLASALYLSTYQQGFEPAAAAQSPMFFPRIILLLWIGLNVVALVQAMSANESATAVASWPRILVIVVSAMVYVNLIGSEGFFLPSVVFAVICLLAFGIRSPALMIVFAIAVPGALVLLFNHTLGMPLPTSRFTHYF